MENRPRVTGASPDGCTRSYSSYIRKDTAFMGDTSSVAVPVNVTGTNLCPPGLISRVRVATVTRGGVRSCLFRTMTETFAVAAFPARQR